MFPWALVRADVQKDAQAPLRAHQAAVSPGPAVVDESAVPDAGHLVVRAKYPAEVRDCRSAKDHDFQKAEAACSAAAVRQDAPAHPDVREQLPARQPQAALQKVVYSREAQPLVEPAQLQAVKVEMRGERVSERLAHQASPRLGLLRGLALPAWEQLSEPQGQLREAAADELLELQV